MVSLYNRRKFLKKAALGSAAVTILKPYSVFGSPENSAVRLGVIGCGSRGTSVASSIVRNTPARITALADLFPDQLAGGRKNFDAVNREKGYSGIAETHLFLGPEAYLRLLESRDVDAVLVSTPAYFHPEHLEAAAAAGKHVYCEKPVAVDVPGVKRVQAAGAKAGAALSLAVGFQIRHASPFVEMVSRIRRGDIGEIVTAQAYYYAGQPMLDWRSGISDDENRIRTWFWFRDLSGDILVEQGIHVVDICNWVLGAHPLCASGMGGREGRDDKGDAWSHFLVHFEYPGKVHITFHSTQLNPGYGDVCERFFGTRGISESHYSGGVFIKGENQWDSGAARGTAETISRQQWAAGQFKSALEDADPNKQKAFIESITSGKFINEAATGAETALSAILGRNAAWSGRAITWEEILNSEERLDPKLDLSRFKSS